MDIRTSWNKRLRCSFHQCSESVRERVLVFQSGHVMGLFNKDLLAAVMGLFNKDLLAAVRRVVR